MSIRDDITSPSLSPPWLIGRGTNGEKFLYTIGLALDMLLEKQNAAMAAKCPGLADDSAIPYQAADRLLVQGVAETNPSFVLRLQNAFTAWGFAGARRASLSQIQAYLTDLQPGIDAGLPTHLTVGGNATYTTWDTMYGDTTQGDPPAHQTITPANWDWDGEEKPWRAWLVLFMHLVDTGQSGSAATIASTGGSGVVGVTSGFATLTGLAGMTSDNVQQYITIGNANVSANNGTFQITSVLSATSIIIANTSANATDIHNGSLTWSIASYPYIGPSPVWGSPDFVWGDFTWGVNCSANVIDAIRQILKRWKSAGTYYPNIIISFGGGNGSNGTEFSPNSSQGTGNPDGTWQDYGKNVAGCWVPSKEPINAFTAFCDGTGLAVNCYAKNVG